MRKLQLVIGKRILLFEVEDNTDMVQYGFVNSTVFNLYFIYLEKQYFFLFTYQLSLLHYNEITRKLSTTKLFILLNYQ